MNDFKNHQICSGFIFIMITKLDIFNKKKNVIKLGIEYNSNTYLHVLI